jgi:DNA segregation ATPase FtsK/SpoIIIE, S-DNA-T family
MADITTDQDDEATIAQVLAYGFNTPDAPKLRVLRVALAKSLAMSNLPGEEFDRLVGKGSEYALQRITGAGLETDSSGTRDFDDALRCILSVLHREDLFSDEKAYRKFLQRHVRRGLRELRTGWSRSHDFMSYLQQDVLPIEASQPVQLSTESIQKQLVKALAEVGVTAVVEKSIEGPRLVRAHLRLSNIHHLDTLKKSLEKLSVLMGLQSGQVSLGRGGEAMMVTIDVPRDAAQWQPIPARLLGEWAQKTVAISGLPVWLGLDAIGNDFSFDLTAAPHLLIAGTTGSGKSVCLNAIVLSLLLTKSPEQLQIAMVDPKRVELSRYNGLPHIYGGEVATDALSAVEIFNELIEEMERRNKSFEELGVTNFEEAIQSQRLSLPRIVLVVEELADLLLQSRNAEPPLVRLAQKSRSAGIHLVLATQRPDAATITGLLRSNIPGRIALKVNKASESAIILDTRGAEGLLGKGDMLVKLPAWAEPVRMHGVNLGIDDITRLRKSIATRLGD